MHKIWYEKLKSTNDQCNGNENAQMNGNGITRENEIRDETTFRYKWTWNERGEEKWFDAIEIYIKNSY